MPQSPGEESDSLFLLEVLVKEVRYFYSNINLDRNILASLQETCVLVKFLHYPVMEIRQESCDPSLDYNAPVVKVGAGKSCLFSLNKKSLACNRKLTAGFNVLRMNPEGGSSSKCVSVGKAIVDLSNNFLQLLKKSCSSTAPATKCINDIYPLINDQCEKVGEISVFLRLSCFGTQITTQFKMSSNDRESFVFKGEDVRDNLNVPSECFKLDCDECPQEEPSGPPARFPGASAVGPPAVWDQQPGTGFYPGQQFAQAPVPQMFQPPYPGSEWGAPNAPNYASPYGVGGPPQFGAPPPNYPPEVYPPRSAGGFSRFGGANDDMYQYGKPWPEKDESCSGRGRVKTPLSPCGSSPPCPPDMSTLKSPCGRQKSTSKSEEKVKGGNGIPSFPQDYPFCQRVTIGETESEDTPVPEGPKLNLCDCDYPVPPGLLNPCPPPPKPKKKKKANCPLEMQPGDYCLRSDCPCGLPMVPWLQNNEGDTEPKKDKHAGKFTMAPGSVGMKGKQIIFQMNDKDIPLTEADKKFMAATQYKLGPIGDTNGKKNVIQVTPDRLDPDPTADKEHDIFILKIGKKNDDQKKAKMEIELKTPKFEDKTPKKTDNETQWLDSDVPAVDKGAKGGKKGKGGKGGKKGKK